MTTKKVFGLKFHSQVWRILVSENDYLLVETRDTDKKEAFFSCFNLLSMKSMFTNIQFEENYWVGVEKFFNDILLLHGYGKPDMPGHKGIIAYNVTDKKIIWQNTDLSYLFIYDGYVYAYIQQFEGRVYYKINLKTGDTAEKLNLTNEEINSLRQKSFDEESYSNYVFPEFLNEESPDEIKKILKKESEGKTIVGDIEFAKKNDFLCFNFHYKSADNMLTNKFFCSSLKKNKIFFTEILNQGVLYPAPDSFFIYKNLLLFIKNKLELCIYQLED